MIVMPEGPEARVMAADVAAFLGLPRRLVRVEVPAPVGHYAPKFVKPELVQGRSLQLLKVEAAGKKVVFSFGEDGSPSLFLVASLAMSGLWQLKPSTWTKMRLTFAGDAGEERSVYFNDSMGWGWLNFCADLREKLRDVGPDLLGDEVTDEVWARAVRRPEPVCWLIVQQRRVSGVGNYLRADALHRAGVAPQRPGDSLSEGEARRLLDACRERMRVSVAQGGHTLDNYYRADGSPGTYRPLVYARPRCPVGHVVTFFLDRDNRKCYYCPACQK
jgi:formamidopyrimidine-DNA glycosylase